MGLCSQHCVCNLPAWTEADPAWRFTDHSCADFVISVLQLLVCLHLFHDKLCLDQPPLLTYLSMWIFFLLKVYLLFNVQNLTAVYLFKRSLDMLL